MVSTPDHAAMGTLMKLTNDTMLQTSMTRRLAMRSTQAPAGSPISSQGSQVSAASALTWKVLASRIATATSGIVMIDMLLPSLLVVSPSHSNRKSRCRSAPQRLLRGGCPSPESFMISPVVRCPGACPGDRRIPPDTAPGSAAVSTAAPARCQTAYAMYLVISACTASA